jgi:hypothetical protein
VPQASLGISSRKWSESYSGTTFGIKSTVSLPKDAHTLKAIYGWAPVAHTCNPSYLGDRQQKDFSLNKSQPKRIVLETPSPKYPEQNVLQVWLKQ